MIILIVLSALIFANLPWVTNHFLIFFKKQKKNNFLILIEITIFYLVFGIFLLFIENQTVGNTHNQDWEFYAITFCLFIIMSFPGFIYKVIWKN